MTGAASLLDAVCGLLERTYLMEPGVDDVGRFVIGDLGYRRLYGSAQQVRLVDNASPDGARLLVRETAGGVRACIYYPDALILRLERYPPQRGVGDENVGPFAVLVEELDHLLVFAERCRQRRPVSLFELELHANVSKHLVLARFLAGSAGRLTARDRLWLRRRLFDDGRPAERDPRLAERYRDATRWAVRFLDAVAALPVGDRIDELRRFHASGAAGKVRRIELLAGG